MKIYLVAWFLPVLALMFVWAKPSGLVAWSWWTVFMPIWVPAVFIVGIIILVVSFGGKIKRSK